MYMEGDNDICNSCQSIIEDNDDVIPLQENYRLAIDLDVSSVNPSIGGGQDRRVRKLIRNKKIEELLKKVSALRNAGGGAIFIHFRGRSESDWSLVYFNEYVDDALTKLIDDGVLFVETYHKTWLFDITEREEHSNFLVLTVKSSQTLTTADFKTKITSDENLTRPTTLNLHKLIFGHRGIENKPPKLKGLRSLPQESRKVQFKSIDKTAHASGVDVENLTTVVNFVWKDLRLREYLTSFTKVDGGGSYFLGIGEQQENIPSCGYKKKIPIKSGVIIPSNLHRPFIENLKKVIVENIFVYTNTKSDISSLVDATFYDLDPRQNRYILEVAVGCIPGCVFYDRCGPQAYTIIEENGKMVKLRFAEWLTKLEEFIHFEPARREVLISWPSNSPFRRQILQYEGTFDEIQSFILKPAQLTIYPPTMSEQCLIEKNLRRRLEEVGSNFPLGLAYITKSLVVLLNLHKTSIPPGQIREVFYSSPHRPSMILCVVDSKTKELRKYMLRLAQKIICQIRKYTDDHFSAVYGLLDRSDLLTLDAFKQTLTNIETVTSVLCNPSSLFMNESKCKNIIAAFLAGIAVTELIPLSKSQNSTADELTFLSKEQFCILVENIDKDLVNVSKSSPRLTVEVARRLEKKGKTILVVDKTLMETLQCGSPGLVSHVVLSEKFGDYCVNMDLSDVQHVVATSVEARDIDYLRTVVTGPHKLVVWLFNEGNAEANTESFQRTSMLEEREEENIDDSLLESDVEDDEENLDHSKNEEGYFTDTSWDMDDTEEHYTRQNSTHNEDMLESSLRQVKEETANTVTSHLIRTVQKCLKDNGVATIVGLPGEGRTTLASQVLAQLNRENWKIYIVKNPKDFFEIKESEKYVVYFKDIFGETNFSYNSYKEWTPVLDKILQMIFQCKPFMYSLFTCRENVFHRALGHAPAFAKTVFNDRSIIDLKHDEVLDEQEKESILKKSDNQRSLAEEHISPLYCKLSTSSLWEEVEALNIDPSNIESLVSDLLQHLIGYAENLAILRIIVHQDSLPDLTVMSKVQKRKMYAAAGVTAVRTKQMTGAVARLKGAILKEMNKSHHVFSHTLISELTARVLATHDAGWFVQYCSLHYLQYVDIRPSDPVVLSDYVIYIDQDMADILGKRLLDELLKEHVHYVLSHPSLRHDTVCSYILDQLEQEDTYKIQDKTTGKRLLHLLPIADHHDVQTKLFEMNMGHKDLFRCLRTCCEYSKVSLMKKLVNRNKDLLRGNQRKGSRLVTMCARRSNTEGCMELLKYIDINIASTNGNTALHHAASTGNMILLTLLLKYVHVRIDIQNKRQETPLARALYCLQEDAARTLIDHGAKTKLRDTHGRTCFMIAALAECLTLLRLIFTSPADLNDVDNMGNTALHLASMRGKGDAARFLIDKGARIHMENLENLTPLHLAARSGRHLLVDILYSHNRQHIQAGIDKKNSGRSTSFDAKDDFGMTALHYAVKWGHELVVGRLLQHQCNVNKTTVEGHTALHLAAMEGYDKIAKILVENGANPRLLDGLGRTPLHYAKEKGYRKIVKILLKDVEKFKKAKVRNRERSDDALNEFPLGFYVQLLFYILFTSIMMFYVIYSTVAPTDIN